MACLFFFILLASPTAYAQALVKVEDSKVNFGFVKRGQLVECNYDISNVGNEPLLIREAEVSCSCTTVDFPRQPLAPGQKTKITIRFNTTSVYGRQDRIVLFRCNDPKGFFKLRYKGIVSNK